MAGPAWVDWLRQAERLYDQKQYDEAAALAQQVLGVYPDNGPALQVLGLVASEKGRVHHAIALLSRAIARQPDLVPAHNGLGRCYYLLEELDHALKYFETALRLQPGHGIAQFNRGMVHLKRGHFHEGWIGYEWRWNCGIVTRPSIPRPRWDGSPLNGRTIMIHTEQGLGDVLQFVRFLPQLKRQGGRVVLACQKALHTLLKPLPSVDEWLPIDEATSINFDICASLLSLPGLLGIEVDNIPREVPYVLTDSTRVDRWQPRIQALPGFKVGICWQGSTTFYGDRLRSMRLAEFAPVAAVPGVTLINLQKGPGFEQIMSNREQVPLTEFGDLDQDGTFVDTAAIMQHLDLVICNDTAIAHLAGSLGRPVWVALSIGCDWRWLIHRHDSPWYPTMKLFRQKAFGDWAGVFQDIAAALRAEV